MMDQIKNKIINYFAYMTKQPHEFHNFYIGFGFRGENGYVPRWYFMAYPIIWVEKNQLSPLIQAETLDSLIEKILQVLKELEQKYGELEEEQYKLPLPATTEILGILEKTVELYKPQGEILTQIHYSHYTQEWGVWFYDRSNYFKKPKPRVGKNILEICLDLYNELGSLRFLGN